MKSRKFMKIVNGVAATWLIGALSSTAFAQEIINPATRNDKGVWSVEAVAARSEIAYGPVVERTVLGGTLALGISPVMDVFAVVGAITDSKMAGGSINMDGLSVSKTEGDGLLFGAGARYLFHEKDKMKAYAYGMLRLTTEELEHTWNGRFYGTMIYGSKDVTIETTELIGGIAASYQAKDNLELYGSLSIVPYSDITVKNEEKIEFDQYRFGGEYGYSFKRADIFSPRLGLVYHKEPFWLRAELTLIGEETLLVSAGRSF
ncbi:MAG TPA: hypothetical protein PKE26_12395 [Kiritimatiellia bacterium]|nr:hypothetical protein [Kiritimatiellia bacterium]HMO99900.1 hypothetical protein [Kiritimatiellia bacterium]HMP96041.1 hypothetical protein [Kiritimatiellia bacterium]